MVDTMRTVKLKDLAASIERRKAELGLQGYDYVTPNSGEYRTPEKRALLDVIEQARGQSKRPGVTGKRRRSKGKAG
jgi:hypothetical protein